MDFFSDTLVAKTEDITRRQNDFWYSTGHYKTNIHIKSEKMMKHYKFYNRDLQYVNAYRKTHCLLNSKDFS